ncbi:flavin reductase family protein [Janibacter sp. GS2]|uniref:flavin reductase family protein n=1 Tax=Janibacter sp. GS2 TaxID=3442646 RepID=UPI003EBFEB37
MTDTVDDSMRYDFRPALLREAFSCFPSGVTAVCTMGEGRPVGLAASSFVTTSLDPPLVSICVDMTSTTWPKMRDAGRFGVSVLAAEQGETCRQLSAKGIDRFAGLSYRTSPEGGAIVLNDAAAWFECSLFDEYPAGDHVMVLLRIEDMGFRPETAPLVFHGSTFKVLRP